MRSAEAMKQSFLGLWRLPDLVGNPHCHWCLMWDSLKYAGLAIFSLSNVLMTDVSQSIICHQFLWQNLLTVHVLESQQHQLMRKHWSYIASVITHCSSWTHMSPVHFITVSIRWSWQMCVWPFSSWSSQTRRLMSDLTLAAVNNVRFTVQDDG